MTTDTTFTTSDDRLQLEAQVTFNADAPLTLSASNASGRVDVTTDATLPAGTIHVAATRTDHGEFADDDHHLTIKVDGNIVSIHPDWQFASGVSGLARRIRDQLQYGFRPEDWNLSRLRLSPELDFHISVRLPDQLADGSQIKLRTASGEIDARRFRAALSIITASGDVDARDLNGTISIHTASGDVNAANILESLEVNTASGDVAIDGGDAWLAARSASGDVEIRNFALRNARVTTVSGDVEIRAIVNNAGNYGIETVSGDVSLDATLPGQDARATLGFGTLSGSSKVGPVWEQQKRREWAAGEGGHRPVINVKTVSGDLSATARLDATVAPRSLAMPVRAEEPEAEPGSHDDLADLKAEMKAFGKEMKQFGKEMKHTFGAGSPPPVPPVPPAPPVHDEEAMRDFEAAMKDYEERVQHLQQEREQRMRDHEQRTQDREQQREQRRAEKEQAREQRRTGEAASAQIFTAGPAGVDYQRDTTPVADDAAPAQPTEPVEPVETFTEEPPMTDTAPSAEETVAPADTPATPPAADARLRVLEALEKGEIDIEDALAQLDRESDKS